jgi:hypothetical protein
MYLAAAVAAPFPMLRKPARLSALVCALVAGASALAPPASAEPNSWSRAADMDVARTRHALATLLDGRVLAAGGFLGHGRFSAEAELYDPRADRWTPARGLPGPRADATATVLRDGRVLLAGGIAGGGSALPLADAMLFDPARNRWEEAGAMSTGRTGHSATLLRDGRVLVAGGSDQLLGSPTGEVDSAEVFDPETRSWTPTGRLRTARHSHFAALVRGGDVLVGGGQTRTGAFASTERWSAATGRWTEGPALGAPSTGDVVALDDGGLLLAGAGPAGDRTERLDPRAAAWSSGPSLRATRAPTTATRLAGGAVLLAAGFGPEGSLRGAELYDPVGGELLPAGPLSTPRFDTRAALLPDGRVLVAGGTRFTVSPREETFLASAELYEPPALPGAPGDVAARAGESSAKVSWTPPSDDGGSPILRYRVTASPSGPVVTLPAAERSLLLEGLAPGRHVFTVTAANVAGESRASLPSAPVTIAGTVPLVPPGEGPSSPGGGGSSPGAGTPSPAGGTASPRPGAGTSRPAPAGGAASPGPTASAPGAGTSRPAPAGDAESPTSAPAAADGDGDGAPADADNCPQAPNADQSDDDRDRIGDACDVLPSGATPPVAGVNSIVRLLAGDVSVTLPGGAVVPLQGVASIPVGAVVDARKGRVLLRSASGGRRAGRIQRATVSAGIFKIRQARARRGGPPVATTLLLQTPRGAARACARRARKGVVRTLSVVARGRFRTVAGASTATATSAAWRTTDRCDGTLTTVTRGRVRLTLKGRRTTTTLTAGRSHLARAPLFG